MQSAPIPFRFLRLREVCARTGLSRSQIYRLESIGRFPRRIKLGELASAWIEAEVQQWCVERISASRKEIAGVMAGEGAADGR